MLSESLAESPSSSIITSARASRAIGDVSDAGALVPVKPVGEGLRDPVLSLLSPAKYGEPLRLHASPESRLELAQLYSAREPGEGASEALLPRRMTSLSDTFVGCPLN